MAKHNFPAVADLLRDQLILCVSSSPRPVVLKLSPSSVKDLEIVNQSELNNQVKSFVTANQIHPASLVIVLSSDICFTKDLTGISATDRPAHTQAFLDTVPLSSISQRVFKVKNAETIIAINRNFFDGIKTAFESSGFVVTAVVPEAILGEVSAPAEFSSNTCRLILRKMDFILENSFLSPPDALLNMHQKEQQFLRAHQTMFVLISIFFILFFLIMAGFKYSDLRTPAKPSPTPSRLRQISPSPVISPSPEASPAAVLSAMTIQILNASKIPGFASQLEKQLRALGITRITTGNSTSVSTQSLVVFTSGVPSPVREQILSEVIKVSPKVSSQETNSGGYEAVITLLKTTP